MIHPVVAIEIFHEVAMEHHVVEVTQEIEIPEVQVRIFQQFDSGFHRILLSFLLDACFKCK